MFTAAIFTTAKRWRRPDVCARWMNKRSRVCTHKGCDPAFKGEEALTAASTRMALQDIVPSEASHSGESKSCLCDSSHTVPGAVGFIDTV